MRRIILAALLLFPSSLANADELSVQPFYEVNPDEMEWEPISRAEVQRLYVEVNDSKNSLPQFAECVDCSLPENKPEFVFEKGNTLILRALSE